MRNYGNDEIPTLQSKALKEGNNIKTIVFEYCRQLRLMEFDVREWLISYIAVKGIEGRE